MEWGLAIYPSTYPQTSLHTSSTYPQTSHSIPPPPTPRPHSIYPQTSLDHTFSTHPQTPLHTSSTHPGLGVGGEVWSEATVHEITTHLLVCNVHAVQVDKSGSHISCHPQHQPTLFHSSCLRPLT